jgi:acetoin utilization deacetylase AcuC-like enzyme
MSFATNTPPAYLQAVIFFLLNFHQVYVLLLKTAAQRNRGSCFGILEGGYNHEVLGQNVLAFVEGLGGK